MADTEEQKAAEAARAKAEAEAQKASEPKMHSDEEFKAVIAERDKAKEKARKFEEAEKKAAEEKAIAEGKQNEIIAQQKAELARLAKVEEEAKARDTAIREQALSKIKDDKFKGIAQELSTPKLLEFTESMSAGGSPFSGKFAHSSNADDNPYRWRQGKETFQEYEKRVAQLKRERK